MHPTITSSTVTRKQFPLRPNTAITIHSSQGRTIPQGVIDLSKASNSGMNYVALSRFPNLSNIRIINLEATKIKVEPLVVEEMVRLRTEKQLTLVCRPIEDIPKPKLRIMFQNVRSVRAHFEDVKSSKEFQSADVLLFCETWLSESNYDIDNYKLDNFKEPDTCQGGTSHRGLVSFSKYKSTIATRKVCDDFELMQNLIYTSG